ncbi:MAG TPA: hypothetical protein VEK08_22345 [Planctomycetota bacterium]|nr:hypothetical protein [Planctomycetota bacterium]
MARSVFSILGMRRFVVGMLSVCLLSLVGSLAHAQKSLLTIMRKHYALERSIGNCKLCHLYMHGDLYPHKFNSYGEAFMHDPRMKPLLGKPENAELSAEEVDGFKQVLTYLERVDSDGDGVLNSEELQLGSEPGNDKSVPNPGALAKFRQVNQKLNPLVAVQSSRIVEKLGPPDAATPPVESVQAPATHGWDWIDGAIILGFIGLIVLFSYRRQSAATV